MIYKGTYINIPLDDKGTLTIGDIVVEAEDTKDAYRKILAEVRLKHPEPFGCRRVRKLEVLS